MSVDREQNWDLLARLTEASGIGGYEDSVRDIVLEYLGGTDTRTSVDNLGNVIAIRGTSGPLIALSAHMDEIGFLVNYVDDGGFVFVQPVGFWEPKTLNAQAVVVTGFTGKRLIGTIQAGKGVP